MRDEAGEDDKIVCVPTHDPGWNHAETLDDIPKQLQDEITHFFSTYKQLEGKEVDVDGWKTLEEAKEVIADGKRLWDERMAEMGSDSENQDGLEHTKRSKGSDPSRDTAEEPEQPTGSDPSRDD